LSTESSKIMCYLKFPTFCFKGQCLLVTCCLIMKLMFEIFQIVIASYNILNSDLVIFHGLAYAFYNFYHPWIEMSSVPKLSPSKITSTPVL
jgi:hypothetical protein